MTVFMAQQSSLALLSVMVGFTIAGVTFAALVNIWGKLKSIGTDFCKAEKKLHEIFASLANGTPRGWSGIIESENLFRHPYLNRKWKQYLETLQNSPERIHQKEVSQYFDEEDILHQNVSVRFLEIAPGILTSLGIVGTFFGILDATGKIMLNGTYNDLKSSLATVISGFSTSFILSSFGVISAIVVNLLYRAHLKKTINRIRDFIGFFHDRISVTSEKEASILMAESITLFMNRFPVLISDGLSLTMRPTLDSMQDTLNDYVKIMTEKQSTALERLIDKFVSTMDASLGEKFVTLRETLKDIDRFKDISASTLSESLVQFTQFSDSMKRYHEITTRQSTVVEKQLEGILSSNQNMEGMVDVLQRNAGSMTTLVENLRAIETSLDAMSTDLKTLQAVFSQKTGEFTESQVARIEGTNAMLDAKIVSFSSEITRSTGAYAEKLAEPLHAMQTTVAEAQRHLEEIKRTDETTIERTNEAFLALQQKIVEGLDEAVQKYKSGFVERTKESLAELTASYQKLAEQMQNLTDADAIRLKQMESQIDESFVQFDTGMAKLATVLSLQLSTIQERMDQLAEGSDLSVSRPML